MRLMELPPDSILYTGDSEPDIQTGRAAGSACAAVTWGYRALTELEAAKPDYIIHKPAELLKI
jgi:phosphoglycolate phosphatase-like HAD superfamily hydrolase